MDYSYETLQNGIDFLLLSSEMKQLRIFAKQIASSDAPVLIMGETGTGKEIFAHFIHDVSSRSKKPFRLINCGAHSEEAFDTLFASKEQGSIRPDDTDAKGQVKRKNNAEGTLFLDEVGDMSIARQADFLHFFAKDHARFADGQYDLSLGSRIIASSSRDLISMVEKGQFRADLLYRLNVISVKLPPLRSRPEEIIPLARHFLAVYGDKYHRHGLSLAPQTENLLISYRWPGNVRELKNLAERLALLAPERSISAKDLPLEMTLPTESTSDFGLHHIDNNDLSLDHARREAEIHVIKRALHRSHGNKSEAARLLGISSRTLRYKFVEYGLHL